MTKARDLANASTALSAVSATELGYVDGVTSAIQTQIDGKQAINANVSTTELGYLDGVTSAIQTQLDATIPKSLVTTAGDIIYRNATVPARLGIGTASQVLAVNSGATAPEWVTPSSGSLTLLSTTTVTSATTTVSSISGAYKFLKIYITNLGTTNANPGLSITFNGSNLFQGWRIGSNSTTFQSAGLNASAMSSPFSYGGASGASNQFGVITIEDYANTTHYKPITFNETYMTSDPVQNSYYFAGKLATTSAITSMTVTWGGTTGMTGTIRIYGGN